MTNKERYKRTFSTLHSSENIALEVENMEKRKNAYMKKVMAACAAVAVIFGGMTAAYAADIGGIQEKLTMWFHGTETDVTATDIGDYSYKYTFTDEDGNPQEFTAGGVAIDDQGNEHKVSAKEILDEMTDEIVIDDTGRTYLFCYDVQTQVDITDLFDEDGICRVSIRDGKKMIYYTIKENGSDGFEYGRTNEEPKDAEHYTLIE